MGQVMQSGLHPSYPRYYILKPLWIIGFTCVTLHPLTIFIVGATCAIQVLQVEIIGNNTIVPTFAGRQRIVLHLPCYQSRIAKIEGHIRIAVLIGRGRAITFVEYPAWMSSFPGS